MHLIIGHTPYSRGQEIEGMLGRWGLQRPDDADLSQQSAAATQGDGFAADEARRLLESLEGPAMLPAESLGGWRVSGQWLQAVETTRLVIFYTRPEVAIARALADDSQSLEQAIEQWAECARSILQTVRHNRRKAALFDTDAVLADPEAFRTACEQRLNLGALQNGVPLEPANDAAEPGDLLRVIAAQTVAQSATLQDLANELEASAIPLPLSQEHAVPDCDAALQEFARADQARRQVTELQQRLDEQTARVASLEGEVERLTGERDEQASLVRQGEQERDAQRERAESLEAQLREQTEAAESLRTQVDQITNERDQTTEENELLLLQLHQVQEELESYYVECQKKEDERRKATEENEHLKNRRDELKLEKRNLEQQVDHLQKRRRELKREKGRLEKRVDYLQERRESLNRDRDRLKKRLERLERNLADIKSSLSWKLTKPVRALRGGPRKRDQAVAEG